jgi:hypothetical protein
MLLTILFGAIAARLLFPHLSNWETGILAAVLAPTDAGLGQIVVNSSRIPMRIRQALNMEAGLNDGLSFRFSCSSSVSLLLKPKAAQQRRRREDAVFHGGHRVVPPARQRGGHLHYASFALADGRRTDEQVAQSLLTGFLLLWKVHEYGKSRA